MAFDPTDGAEIWTRQFGSAADESLGDVFVDGRGHIYLVGATSGTLAGQVSAGKRDAFVRKSAGDLP